MPYFNSTAIERGEYDHQSGDLTIWFRKGRHFYTCYGVPRSIWDELLQASSKGTYFDNYIKDRYSYRS